MSRRRIAKKGVWSGGLSRRLVSLGVVTALAGGGLWSLALVPASPAYADSTPVWTTSSTGSLVLTQISCATATSCMADTHPTAADQLEVTNDGGVTWTAVVSEPEADLEVGPTLVCPTASTCIAAGVATVTTEGTVTIPGATTTTSDGTTVTTPASTTTVYTTSDDAAISTTHNDGTTWDNQTFGAGWVDSISCPTTVNCLALVVQGSTGAGTSFATYSTSDGGDTWTENRDSGLPYGSDGDVSCTTAETCLAAVAPEGPSIGGYELLSTSDGGASWTGAPGWTFSTSSSGGGGITVGNSPTSVSCTSSGACVVTATNLTSGYSPYFVSLDGGATWSNLALPSGVTAGEVQLAFCPDTNDCFLAVDGTAAPYLQDTSNLGASWTTETVSGDISSFGAVSCPAPSSCILTGTFDSDGVVLSSTPTDFTQTPVGALGELALAALAALGFGWMTISSKKRMRRLAGTTS